MTRFYVEATSGADKSDDSVRRIGEFDTRDEAIACARRLIDIFLLDADGHRPVWGGEEMFQNDPHWRDELLFYEYFHGDNGAGIGASHQTGWTALVANLIDEWR